MTAEERTSEPYVEVLLSRTSYRVGQTVVGTVRLVAPEETNAATSSLSPREIFSDTYLYVAGWCRLDPRWHKIEDYAKFYESPAVHKGLQTRPLSSSNSGNVTIDDKCVCFWTTNVINLLELQERTIGRWEDVKPKSLRASLNNDETAATSANRKNASVANLQAPVGGAQGQKDSKDAETKQLLNGNDDDGDGDDSNENAPPLSMLEKRQLAFTFRAELPVDLPQSSRLNSCRYFYAVMVGTRARTLNSARKQWICHSTPVRVLSLSPNQIAVPTTTSNDESTTQQQQQRMPMGTCTAMRHSAGLPCHVTATDLHEPTGQIHVNRQGTASLGNLVKTFHSSNLATMRITDLQGHPCCVLTVMGVSVATPGSRMVLKFDFTTPRQDKHNNPTTSSWTPCYQVSASLEGEEVVIHANGTRKRTKAYQFDTAYEAIDPDCTERVCISLLMPLDAPTTLRTNVVELEIHLCIDITVGNSNPKGPVFNNLRLQLPCRVVHNVSEYEVVLKGENDEEDEDDAMKKLPLDELILGTGYRTGEREANGAAMPPLIETDALRNTADLTHPSSFQTKDIHQDLKLLSIRMAKNCHLIKQ